MSMANLNARPSIHSRIVSLCAEQNELQFAVPGGLIGVGTTMDPTLTRADRLVGQVLGEVGSLPDVYIELEVGVFFAAKYHQGLSKMLLFLILLFAGELLPPKEAAGGEDKWNRKGKQGLKARQG